MTSKKLFNHKKDKNKGYLFWITGLSGAGKTSIAKLINKDISKQFGRTMVINGDDLRNIFKLDNYDPVSRLNYGKQYCKLLKFLTDQNINVIFTVVGLFEELREWNKQNIKNYCEIYIKSNISTIKKFGKKKKIYKNKNKNIVGLQIKPEFPKRPHIVINNNFKKDLKFLSKKLLNKILK